MSIPKIVFIVPYRNREEEKLHFSIFMRYILEDYDKNDYEIYYSHQKDNKPFSRGGTKNIGFLAIKKKYPKDYKNITLVFNDVDTVPSRKNMLNYRTSKGIVKHFFGFNFTLGGIFSITGEDFERCNGFPNLYGWGLEDNTMNDRVKSANIKIDRTNFYPIRSKKILNIFDGPNRLINNKEPTNYNKRLLNDNLSDIKNLDYSIVPNKEFSNINNENEFMININNFDSLINPRREDFYVQDISKSAKLKTNVLEKQRIKEQWSMKRMMGI